MFKKVVLIFALMTIPSFVSATGINVANLYGTATSNGWYANQSPDLAIDGTIYGESYWVAPNHGTISNPNWLIIDLGDVYSVSSIDLKWQPNDGRYHNYTTNYNLYYGMNNSDWQFLGSGVFVDETPDIHDTYTFSPLTLDMRFVKYEVDGGSHWSSIAEIEVWVNGDGSPTPIPEPATMLLLGAGTSGLMMRHRKKQKISAMF